jgi:hypothetical protein
VPPAAKDVIDGTHDKDTPPIDTLLAAEGVPPADRGSITSEQLTTGAPMDVNGLHTPPTGNSTPTPHPIIPSSPSLLHACCPEKYVAVLELFNTEVQGGLWKSAVDIWLMLEHAAGFQISEKPLPARHPRAVLWWVQRRRGTTWIPAGLSSEDEHEDFYDAVILWWLIVNLVWRKEGVTNAEEFKAHGLIQHGEDDLEGLPSGLNRLTSILTCLA